MENGHQNSKACSLQGDFEPRFVPKGKLCAMCSIALAKSLVGIALYSVRRELCQHAFLRFKKEHEHNRNKFGIY